MFVFWTGSAVSWKLECVERIRPTAICRLFGYISSLLSEIDFFFPPQCYCENASLLMFGTKFPVLSVSYVDSFPKRKKVPEVTVIS